jgi:hypothetical protein
MSNSLSTHFPVGKIYFLARSSFTNIASSVDSMLLAGDSGAVANTLLLLSALQLAVAI